MFWSGETIERRATNSNLVTDFNHGQIDCAAYQLRMGQEAFITPDRKMRKRYQRNKLFLKPGDNFSIPPGQFTFLLTKEYLEIPVDTIGFISLRTGMKYLGLVNVSGFHVDPGFRGHLIYAVYNAGPANIIIDEGQPLFLIWFANLDCSQTNYHRLDRPPQLSISREIIQHIPGHILSLQSVTDKIEGIERNVYRIIYGFIIGGVLLSLGLMALAVDWAKWSALLHR